MLGEKLFGEAEIVNYLDKKEPHRGWSTTEFTRTYGNRSQNGFPVACSDDFVHSATKSTLKRWASEWRAKYLEHLVHGCWIGLRTADDPDTEPRVLKGQSEIIGFAEANAPSTVTKLRATAGQAGSPIKIVDGTWVAEFQPLKEWIRTTAVEALRERARTWEPTSAHQRPDCRPQDVMIFEELRRQR